MELSNVIREYTFENAGQFRAIMASLGFTENAQGQEVTFSDGKNEISYTITEMREAGQNKEDIEIIQDNSRKELIQFFDKDRAETDFENYQKELSEKNITLYKWDDLKADQKLKDGQSKDGYTIIDHENKVSYTGKSLYNFAYENDFILDGEGTQVEKGKESPIVNRKGKKGKYYRGHNDKLSFYSQKDALVIPPTLFGKKLSEEQQFSLQNGKVICVKNENENNIYIKIDKDLNTLIVAGEKELNIPNVIGNDKDFEGYKLTDEDKLKFANGEFIEPKIMKGKDGYFLAEVTLTEDKKGFKFRNIDNTISQHPEMIKQYIEKYNKQDLQKSIDNAINVHQNAVESQKQEELTAEQENIISATENNKEDSIEHEAEIDKTAGKQSEITQDNENNIKGSIDNAVSVHQKAIENQKQEELTAEQEKNISATENNKKASIEQEVEIDKTAEKQEEINKDKEIEAKENLDRDKETIITKEKDSIEIVRDLDKEFADALNQKDYKKLNELATKDNYSPSKDFVETKFKELDVKDQAALETIFDLKTENLAKENKDIAKSANVVIQDKTKDKGKDKEQKTVPGNKQIVEKAGNLINQAFNNM